jgi:hypothetical protein
MKYLSWKFLGLFLLLLCACTEHRVKRYAEILEPRVGVATKEEVTAQLGQPAFCRPDSQYQLCEYRTASGRNAQTPEVYRRQSGFGGPDVSPYEHFDVIHAYFDNFGTLRDWKAIVVEPQS